MPDVHDVATRSFNMSRVRSHSNRSTEIRLAELFRAAGIVGWRRRYQLFGKPDFVFPAQRVAVFVDGCFWHGCSKGCRPLPRSSRFWRDKIAANIRRDRLVTSTLRQLGWNVIRIWEHALRPCNKAQGDRVLSRIKSAIAATNSKN